MSFWAKILGFDPNRKKQFSGQQPGEEVELLTVLHEIVLLKFFLYFFLLFFIVLGLNLVADFFTNLSPVIRFYINTIAIALLIHVFCFRLYNHFLKVIILTNHRLIDIKHTVLLIRQREVIPLTNIQDFRYKQNGIISRIFGYGDLIIFGSSSDVKYIFKHMPKVNKVHHILAEAHQKRLLEIGNIRTHVPVSIPISSDIPQLV